jgi:hypothetical protein
VRRPPAGPAGRRVGTTWRLIYHCALVQHLLSMVLTGLCCRSACVALEPAAFHTQTFRLRQCRCCGYVSPFRLPACHRYNQQALGESVAETVLALLGEASGAAAARTQSQRLFAMAMWALGPAAQGTASQLSSHIEVLD